MCESWPRKLLFVLSLIGALICFFGIIAVNGMDFDSIHCEYQCEGGGGEKRFLEETNNSSSPSVSPSLAPSAAPSLSPSLAPSETPRTWSPTHAPTGICSLSASELGTADLKRQLWGGSALVMVGWIVMLLSSIQLNAKYSRRGELHDIKLPEFDLSEETDAHDMRMI